MQESTRPWNKITKITHINNTRFKNWKNRETNFCTYKVSPTEKRSLWPFLQNFTRHKIFKYTFAALKFHFDDFTFTITNKHFDNFVIDVCEELAASLYTPFLIICSISPSLCFRLCNPQFLSGINLVLSRSWNSSRKSWRKNESRFL